MFELQFTEKEKFLKIQLRLLKYKKYKRSKPTLHLIWWSKQFEIGSFHKA